MYLQPPKLAAKIAAEFTDETLFQRTNEYIAWLDANPIQGDGVFNPDTGKVERPLLPRVPTGTGFNLFLGLKRGEFPKLQALSIFLHCMEKLRRKLLEEAVSKEFAKLLAAHPLLGYRV